MKSFDNSKPEVLILGGTGLIGRLACAAYHSSHFVHITGRTTPSTTSANENESFTPLELAAIPSNLNWPRFEQIIVCSGAGDQSFCESDPALSRQINVDGVIEILSRYASRETKVVLCSSDVAHENAQSEYARQKYELEKWVHENFSRHAILRFGKVLENHRFIGVKWRQQLAENIPLTVRPELFFSPVLQSQVKQIFEQAAKENLHGTYVVSANDEWSYLTLAKWLKGENIDSLLKDTNFVRPRHCTDLIPDSISTLNTLSRFFSPKMVP